MQASGKELGSRKKKRDEALPSSSAASGSPPAAQQQQQQGGRGQKFRARKSREAAAKAAELAVGATQPEAKAKETATSQLEPVKVPDTPPSKN